MGDRVTPAPGGPCRAAGACGRVPEYAARVTEPHPALAPAADPWRRHDRWASIFFLSLAAVTLIVALTVLTAAEAAGGDVLAWLLAVTIADIAVLFVASVALDRGAPWARTAAVGMLAMIVAGDAISVLVDLTRSTITIPLAGIIALYLLSIRPGPLPRLAGRDRSMALLVAGSFLVITLVTVALQVVGPASAPAGS